MEPVIPQQTEDSEAQAALQKAREIIARLQSAQDAFDANTKPLVREIDEDLDSLESDMDQVEHDTSSYEVQAAEKLVPAAAEFMSEDDEPTS